MTIYNTAIYKKFLFSFLVFIFYFPLRAQVLTITSPNGNEFWQVGKTPSITWDSEGLTENIVLEYSTNNGYTWLPIDTVLNTTNSYEWLIPNTVSTQCLVRATSNSVEDASNASFEISDDDSSCTIVVLGSSTAYGNGASSPENAWVNLYASAIFQKNTKLNVVNLAYPGYNTFKILPTGTTIAGGETIDTNKNITKALSYSPVALIINMPSNDTADGYSAATQMENYATLNTYANNNSVPLWIATTQPRNFSNSSEIQTQIDVKDELLFIYADKAIDFWNGIADTDGKILGNLDYGDGIHVNNLGHDILFNKVLNKNIDGLTCLSGTLNTPKTIVNNNIDLQVFPNPFTDFIFLKFNSKYSGELKVVFYDVLGRKLTSKNKELSFKTGNNTINIGLKELESLQTQFIYGIFTFKTNNSTIIKRVKLVLN